MNTLRVSFKELAYDIARERLADDNAVDIAGWSAIISYFVEKRCIAEYRGTWLRALLKTPVVFGERCVDGTKYAYIEICGVIVAHLEKDSGKLEVEYKGVKPFYRDITHEVMK